MSIHRNPINTLILVIFGICQSQDFYGAETTERARFHHVHLNVEDVEATQRFYSKFFGANLVNFNGKTKGLFTEKSFLLLNRVSTPPRTHLETCLWHIGWAGVDGPSEFQWRKEAGAKVLTPVTPLGNDHFMYFQGPTDEVVEIYTGSRNHRFEHVHLLATDVNKTIAWLLDHLNLTNRSRTVPRPAPELDPNALRGIWMNSIQVDNVNLVVFGKPRPGTKPFWAPPELNSEFAPTKGSSIDHIAFSFRSIEPAFQRMQRAGATIEQPISVDSDTGMKHFFVLSPDALLVESVEAKPIPEGVWE